MMELLKKNLALLSAAVVCLGLTACGGGGDIDGGGDIGGDDDIGADWRTWGIIQSSGTITRNGEDTEVMVCVNKKASNFYYDTDSQTLFDGVEYPPALADMLAPAEDVWAMYKSTDFSDLNGDGNTDVTMWFDDNGSEIKAVWFWDTENGQFIFQPNESNLGDEGRGDIDIGGGDDDVGGDWRTWGIIQSHGTITRNGEDTYVLVCVNKKASNFYYDTDSQALFDGVEYPPALADKLAPAEDVWAMYKSTDFSDLNGDGNTDVTMWFDDNGSEIKAVWFWDTESSQYVFQPSESQIGDEAGSETAAENEIESSTVTEEVEIPVLMGGALPFTNMETLRSEKNDDGTYYYSDVTEDGQIMVVNTALLGNWDGDVQPLEDYISECAVSLCETDTYAMLSFEQNDEYTQKMTYPVYIVTYTAGESENMREWTVYAMDTDTHTYLYGFCAAPDAVEDVTSVFRDIFSGLYLE